MENMTSRISSLEKSLAKATEEEGRGRSAPRIPFSDASNTTTSPSSVAGTHSGKLNERSNEDILVQKGSSSHYFNEILLSRIIGEERNIESVLTSPPTEPPYPPASPFNALGILSSPFLSQAPFSFHPLTPVAVKLWNIYTNNVESCTGTKMLHLPTDEFKVYSTIIEPQTGSLEDLALCFAIYFAATVSLDDLEAEAALGQDKRTHLLRLKVGLEQAFAQGDFLDRPTLTGLRSLAIYLSALRVHNRGKGIWILNGLAIRIAQSLGLHRDGERLGLSPFQSEMRHRLWWHFLSRDGRAGEDYGLENTSDLLLMSNVSLPLNVDDADLYPDMDELPTEKKGWTAMMFS
ncbi:uncharacterized protein Z518_05713 [Rhinocladiella mackenziei CBS 650.93]|uniref:Rhinocladiella mackenziei CBS 650.93 unplaced genomic scaffold supercont1.4, whole genome shotgun sequence n=1 Tax=Rhinocladiella mackenziei CBS 650.93 TaxID=1442369 RepID=A0A0D2FRP8_9EURO|nr:uncharacterized protein Z518_05713 [Rhinocladiella mackenziei CBS 650.93]KIX04842.1 hypothetical protein Z518_05713 [Rhinocladiella mackenziei CBS 650.93]